MGFTHKQNINKKSRNGDTLGPVELIVQPEQGKAPRQKRFSGFCPLRGGGPPCPLSFFEHNDCPLRGGGDYPPIPLRKKSAKNGYFWPKNANLSPF